MKIFILGCSHTYGSYLNDAQTYPFKLQNALPEYALVNCGVEGYSLYQMLLALERNIKLGRIPGVLILAFYSNLSRRGIKEFNERWHNMRYQLNPSCISKNGNLLRHPPDCYRTAIWSRHSIWLEGFERIVNFLRLGKCSNKDTLSTGCHLLLIMKHLCERHGIRFHVMITTSSPRYYEFFWKNKFSWSLCPLDKESLMKSRLLPFDIHPNEYMNDKWSEHLLNIIPKVASGEIIRPELDNIVGNWSNTDTTTISAYNYQLF